MAGGSKKTGEKEKKKRSANFSHEDMSTLVGLVLHQNTQKKVVKGNPTKRGWQLILVLYNQIVNKKRPLHVLRLKWKALKSRFLQYKILSSKTGWGWNYTWNIPQATQDLWAKAIAFNKKYEKIKDKPFPWFKEMEIICAGLTTDNDAVPISVSIPRANEISMAGGDSIGSTEDDDDDMVPTPEANLAGHSGEFTSADNTERAREEIVDDVDPTTQAKKAGHSNEFNDNTGREKEKSLGGGDNAGSAGEDDVVPAPKTKKARRSAGCITDNIERAREDILGCMNALNKLEGIDSVAYLKAVRIIHDDALWRFIFLQMPNNRRKDWVLRI